MSQQTKDTIEHSITKYTEINQNPLPKNDHAKRTESYTEKERKKDTDTYNEVREVDDGPSHARRTAQDGQDKKPREEEDEDVGGPHPWVHEPLRIPVQIRRWHRLHVQIRHSEKTHKFLGSDSKKLTVRNQNYKIKNFPDGIFDQDKLKVYAGGGLQSSAIVDLMGFDAKPKNQELKNRKEHSAFDWFSVSFCSWG